MGVGVAPWEAAWNTLAGDGYRDVTLWVLAANLCARCFYGRIGFALEADAQKTFESHGATAPEVRYRRSIGGP